MITADGSFGDLKRPDYINAEEKTIQELKQIGKPFVLILNSSRPYSEETVRLAAELGEKYGVNVVPVNCEQLKKDDVKKIMEQLLMEFPVTELDFYIPNGWRSCRRATG